MLQPPVVLPAARVAAAWPAYTEQLASAKWVVLMGARRRTAAGLVCGNDPDATLDVLVREDAIADDPLAQLDAMTAENVARAPWREGPGVRRAGSRRAASSGTSPRGSAARSRTCPSG